jgi:hypothetical protein
VGIVYLCVKFMQRIENSGYCMFVREVQAKNRYSGYCISVREVQAKNIYSGYCISVREVQVENRTYWLLYICA